LCIILESLFFLEGPGGLVELIEKMIRDFGHMVIVMAEGAGQDLIAQDIYCEDSKDASGNKLLLDVGLSFSQNI
jgi:6-phosphofructokinase 1